MIERRTAIFAAFVTFLLMCLGGYVHNTESSLACPDWPTCYGTMFPKMQGGILIEHSHRLLGALVGFISILLLVFTWKNRKSDSFLKKMTVFALGVVIFQGLLGGITVIYKLPTIVSTTHLSTAMAFFCLLVFIYHDMRVKDLGLNIKNQDLVKKLWSPSLKHGTFFLGLMLYLQIILGAFMRHSGAGAACGLGMKNAFLCFEPTTWKNVFWPTVSASQLHMVHRIYAALLGLAFIGFFTRLFVFIRKAKLGTSFKFYSLAPIVLILVQIVLGVLTVTSHIAPIPTMFHLAFGALSLVFTWKMYLNLASLEKTIHKDGESYSLLSDLVELSKPRLSGLVVLTALIGMVLAPGHINFFRGVLAIFLTTLLVMGACAFNCYLEREVDAKMNRTKNRALPAKRMKPRTALIFSITLMLASLYGLYFFVNPITAGLGFIAGALYLYAYTPLKRFSTISLYVGAIPGALPPVMGWTAVQNSIDFMALSLFAVLFIWQLPHFMSIAIYHNDDYSNAEIKTIVNSAKGNQTKFWIFILTVLLLAVSLVPTLKGELSLAYQKSAVGLGLMFVLFSAYGFFTESETLSERVWAKNYFRASILYLPGLLACMIFLR